MLGAGRAQSRLLAGRVYFTFSDSGGFPRDSTASLEENRKAKGAHEKLFDHWREDEKERWTRELLCICSYKLLFRLRIGSEERPIRYDCSPQLPPEVSREALLGTHGEGRGGDCEMRADGRARS